MYVSVAEAENGVDLDTMTSSEAILSGSIVFFCVFFKKDKTGFSMTEMGLTAIWCLYLNIHTGRSLGYLICFKRELRLSVNELFKSRTQVHISKQKS